MNINIQDYIECVYIGDYLTRLDEYIGTNLLYEYKCNGEWTHTHDFVTLLRYILWDVFEEDDAQFDFSDSKEQYSEQELIVINKFIEQAKRDKKKLNDNSSYVVMTCLDNWKLP